MRPTKPLRHLPAAARDITNLKAFLAAATGRAAGYTIVELGTVQVRPGALIARDPCGPRSGGYVLAVPNGSHRVEATAVDVSDDGNRELRAAYANVAIGADQAALLGSADELLAPPVPSFGAFTDTDHGLLAVRDAAEIFLPAATTITANSVPAMPPQPSIHPFRKG
ncbi:hypothetical protein OS122_29095 [Mycolicibacterium mucogenicum]|uniref:hypothetical protein n=1 Tax=Mycolicibacterium mucogenicum TaxID=56689 RepID=UPI00226AB643|nr:hypothetical protein [Mycolicibacterium mucogenicum]MCX8564942.1 hypothetical protein [Mycolicibacterium mucogenicum]